MSDKPSDNPHLLAMLEAVPEDEDLFGAVANLSPRSRAALPSSPFRMPGMSIGGTGALHYAGQACLQAWNSEEPDDETARKARIVIRLLLEELHHRAYFESLGCYGAITNAAFDAVVGAAQLPGEPLFAARSAERFVSAVETAASIFNYETGRTEAGIRNAFLFGHEYTKAGGDPSEPPNEVALYYFVRAAGLAAQKMDLSSGDLLRPLLGACLPLLGNTEKGGSRTVAVAALLSTATSAFCNEPRMTQAEGNEVARRIRRAGNLDRRCLPNRLRDRFETEKERLRKNKSRWDAPLNAFARNWSDPLAGDEEDRARLMELLEAMDSQDTQTIADALAARRERGRAKSEHGLGTEGRR